jgi:hypothetical protein
MIHKHPRNVFHPCRGSDTGCYSFTDSPLPHANPTPGLHPPGYSGSRLPALPCLSRSSCVTHKPPSRSYPSSTALSHHSYSCASTTALFLFTPPPGLCTSPSLARHPTFYSLHKQIPPGLPDVAQLRFLETSL